MKGFNVELNTLFSMNFILIQQIKNLAYLHLFTDIYPIK